VQRLYVHMQMKSEEEIEGWYEEEKQLLLEKYTEELATRPYDNKEFKSESQYHQDLSTILKKYSEMMAKSTIEVQKQTDSSKQKKTKDMKRKEQWAAFLSKLPFYHPKKSDEDDQEE